MKKVTQTSQDLIIIGGGIMGLMTAYYAANFVNKITILEKRTIGKENKEAASFSYTRSIRTDYLESFYATLAYEAQQLWLALQQESAEELFVKCGCLNIAKKSLTPTLSKTYAQKSYQNIKNLNYQPVAFNKNALKKRFPQFEADIGRLDTKGGFLMLQTILSFLLKTLKKKKITVIENIDITKITEKVGGTIITTNNGTYITSSVVITAGKGTNGLLKKITNNKLTFPIRYERPQRKYYYPPKELAELFLPENFPVFAYTDVGIYGHPIFDKKKNAVKVAYFIPVGMKKDANKIKNVDEFINECLPLLKNVPSEEITDADNCWYDTVEDDDFILGKLPGFEAIAIGTGWRGTGYKFAPLIGKILSQLGLQNSTIYDIKQFSPARFIK
jgi:glycine/D-amino acid oxidase-like deaminating enzyme